MRRRWTCRMWGSGDCLGVEKEAKEKSFRGRENPKRGTTSSVSWKEAG